MKSSPSRIAGVVLAAALAFSAAARSAEAGANEDESLPDSVVAALDKLAAQEMQDRDSCAAIGDAYYQAVAANPSDPPPFTPTPCVTATGKKVLLSCNPENVQKISSAFVKDSSRMPDFSCRTSLLP